MMSNPPAGAGGVGGGGNLWNNTKIKMSPPRSPSPNCSSPPPSSASPHPPASPPSSFGMQVPKEQNNVETF